MWAIMRATSIASWVRIAWRATFENAMFCAVRRALAHTSTARSISSGWSSAHCRICMPPSEPPTAAYSRSMPSSRSSARCTSARSRTVNSGKSSPYGSPVAGLIELGPDVPLQPPSRFAQMTWKRSVSTTLPGPISVSHQTAASASPVSAWQM